MDKQSIYQQITEYYKEREQKPFNPKTDRINYGEAIYDHEEINAILDVLLDGWLTLGEKGQSFARGLSEYLGVQDTVLVNSGSSANLLALTALKLERNSEVVTPALTFPTTFAPIMQNNLNPVVVDVNLDTLNIDVEKIKEVIDSRTKAIMLPHLFGNSCNMNAILDIVEDYRLNLIEDACEALGSEYNGRKVGSFGVLSTCSFHPAHHFTTMEGGSISLPNKDINLYRTLLSLRDWGKQCWCLKGEEACGKRFEFEIDGIPYDHRYIYSNVGYNLKMTEVQAAMGLIQLKRLPLFVEKRRENFQYLYDNLKRYSDYLSFVRATENSIPSWFAFPLLVCKDAPFKRNDFVRFLEKHRIQTRLILTGDITRQPAYQGYRFRSTSLESARRVMRDGFFIGCHPKLEKEHLDYVVSVFDKFFERYK